MLQSRSILIAEDEPITAFDLAEEVESASGRVVGPFHSVAAAMAGLQTAAVHAAILDIELADGLVTPLALALLERQVILLFHSASPIPVELAERCGKVSSCPKPMASHHVVRHLHELLQTPA